MSKRGDGGGAGIVGDGGGRGHSSTRLSTGCAQGQIRRHRFGGGGAKLPGVDSLHVCPGRNGDDTAAPAGDSLRRWHWDQWTGTLDECSTPSERIRCLTAMAQVFGVGPAGPADPQDALLDAVRTAPLSIRVRAAATLLRSGDTDAAGLDLAALDRMEDLDG